MSSGVQGRLTQHPELQLPDIHAGTVGGLAAVQPSVRGLDGGEMDRALGPPTLQGRPVLGPVQLGLRGALGHTVQVQNLSCQHLQDPRAWLYLRGH